ncbi:MAG TPA: hypothetical protein VKH35_13800 [Thermoanaerobaculia bacterium]|nr:hypothetical protein [Thermoanaerobaculia bacterium]
MLIRGLETDEIRVLQEFRRVTADALSLAAINAIKHPAGGGEAPARSLVTKGYLTADPAGEIFKLTPKAKEFLASEPKPEFEEGSATAGDATSE